MHTDFEPGIRRSSPAAHLTDLTAAYGVFWEKARHLDPEYRPETVNTDGWPATQADWRELFQGVTLILCFLHAFLKIRERAVHLSTRFCTGLHR